jgi:cobalt/nickel transport system permease protein
MLVYATLSLLAVHIADGVLAGPWLLAGFAGAALLACLGAWRLRDEDVPRVALLTAAFFVSSAIHIRVGPTSVHLLLTGLIGVLLGRHAGLAIPVGLFLQAALLQHGGFTTLGINSCIMAVPALAAGHLFHGLQRLPWVRQPWFRAGLVGASFWVWILSVIYTSILLGSNRLSQLSRLDLSEANAVTLHPLTLAAALVLAALAAWAESRLEYAPDFPLGLLVGEFAVLLTVLLNSLVLMFGGQEDWPSLVLIVVVPHLFIAVLEGIVLGFIVGFLAQVKPAMLGGPPREQTECLVESAPQ